MVVPARMSLVLYSIQGILWWFVLPLIRFDAVRFLCL